MNHLNVELGHPITAAPLLSNLPLNEIVAVGDATATCFDPFAMNAQAFRPPSTAGRRLETASGANFVGAAAARPVRSLSGGQFIDGGDS